MQSVAKELEKTTKIPLVKNPKILFAMESSLAAFTKPNSKLRLMKNGGIWNQQSAYRNAKLYQKCLENTNIHGTTKTEKTPL